jgi:hypothetical protein
LALSVLLLPRAEAKPSSPPLPLQGEVIAARSVVSCAKAAGALSSREANNVTRKDINGSPDQAGKEQRVMILDAFTRFFLSRPVL